MRVILQCAPPQWIEILSEGACFYRPNLDHSIQQFKILRQNKALNRLLITIQATAIDTVHFLTNHRFLSSFSSKVQWFLLLKLHLQTKQFCKYSFQEMTKSFVLFPSAAFAIFITQQLWLWSRIERVKIKINGSIFHLLANSA